MRWAHVGDVGRFLRHLQAAVDAFERAGDVRNVSLERTTVAWCWAELGELARAAAIGRDNLARCQALRAPQAITYAKVNLGYILTLDPAARAEGRAILDDAIAECRALGDAAVAVDEARAAIAVIDRLGGLLQGETTPPLALVEALRATGDEAGATAAAADALRRLRARAERLGDPAWQASFLTLPDNRRTAALAAAG